MRFAVPSVYRRTKLIRFKLTTACARARACYLISFYTIIYYTIPICRGRSRSTAAAAAAFNNVPFGTRGLVRTK